MFAIITREQVTHSVYSIKKENLQWKSCNTLPSTILKPINIKPKQLKNARNKYLINCSDDKILILVDYTLFNNGKTGCVFSTDAFYCSELYSYSLKNVFPYPLRYDSIKRIEQGRDTAHLVFTLHSGKEAEIHFGIYANFIFIALNRILELRKTSRWLQPDAEYEEHENKEHDKQDADEKKQTIESQQATENQQPEIISDQMDPLKSDAICKLLTVLNQIREKAEVHEKAEVQEKAEVHENYSIYVQYMTLAPLHGVLTEKQDNI